MDDNTIGTDSGEIGADSTETSTDSVEIGADSGEIGTDSGEICADVDEVDIWGVLSQDSTPIFKFATEGDSIRGVIAEPPVVVPLTEFGTNMPKFDSKGQLAKQILLVLRTEHVTDDAPDGVWRVYVDKPRMRGALRRAMSAAGVRTMAVGDVLELTYTGYYETGSGNQAKEFTAEYKPAAEPGPVDEPPF